MDSGENRSKWDEILINIARIVIVAVFVISIAYLMIYSTTTKNKGNMPTRVIYLDEWECSYDNVRESITLPCNLNINKGTAVTYTTKLPNDIIDGDWIAIMNSKDMTISIDGHKRYEWHRESADVPGGPAKSVYMFVPLSSRDAGKTISIVKDGQNQFNGGMKPILIGDSLSLIDEIESKDGIEQFMMALAIMFFAVIVMAVSLILSRMFKQKINLISISFGVLITSLWLVFDSNIFSIITGVKYVDGILSYIVSMLMPIPYIVYIDEIQKKRYRTLYAFLCIVELLNLLICTALHLTGISNFSEMLVVLDIVIAWIILLVIGCVIFDIIGKRAKDYMYVAVGMIVFMVLCVAEILAINVVDDRTDGVLILTGLFILLISAMCQQIKDISVVQAERNSIIDADKARNEFLSNMSHEIRTPINAILGMNEMILEKSESLQISGYAEGIEKSGRMLMALINDIFDYSQFREGKDELKIIEYNVRKMLDAEITILREHAEAKGLGVNVGIQGDMPEVMCGDPEAIARIISNIMSNAIKYTETGSITFAVECMEQENEYLLKIFIEDTGKGIDKNNLNNIFKAFKRIDLKRNQSIEGAGLGLSIVKQLVDRMGGSIDVSSTPDVGTAFTVIIPQGKVGTAQNTDDIVDDVHASENEKDSVKDALTVDDNNQSVNLKSGAVKHSYIAPDAHILAVDDNNANIIVVKEFLKKLEVKLDTATGGAEAIEKCKAAKYDIILMDHMMPEPDGVEAMHTIRDSLVSLNRRTPIIVLTANVVGNCREKYIQEGFDGYLSKPLDREELFKTIKLFLKPKLVIDVDEIVNDDEKAAISDVSQQFGNENDTVIDFKRLDARFEGQQTVIDMVLAECVKEGERKKILLRELFESGDIARYAVEAHGVKGVMASVCADKISERAKSHEFAAKENRVDFIKEDLDGFLEEYGSVLEYIENIVESHGVKIERSNAALLAKTQPDSIAGIIANAIQSLDDFDVETAIKYIDKLEDKVDSDKVELVANARKFADDFDYESAIDCLKQI